ncbi:hypothetical protein NLU13_2606 [Sarocladium strictum]|uniref:Uncharacterized protein n=1 Tax=Sarocladium strictum TaxID=5046 RepID=A0AA39L9M2_SARSR|nr:hypothetical protein NLU13_2606 [Sarocladium strictum]
MVCRRRSLSALRLRDTNSSAPWLHIVYLQQSITTSLSAYHSSADVEEVRKFTEASCWEHDVAHGFLRLLTTRSLTNTHQLDICTTDNHESLATVSQSYYSNLGSSMSRGNERERCQAKGCRRDAVEYKLRNQKKLRSRYCLSHTCRVGWGCKEEAKSRSLYCKNHKTCAESGCHNEGQDLHLCASEWYCREHECPIPSCHLPAKPRHHHPFNVPVPPAISVIKTCDAPECPGQPVGGSNFCDNHKCTIEDCPEAREYPDGRCAGHKPCEAQGCPGFGRWNELKQRPERFCWGHEECTMLTCRASVPAGLLHCDFHRCKLDGCRAEKYVWETMSDYCRVHTCGTKDCTTPIQGRDYLPPNVTSVWFRHCQRHTCSRLECVKEAAVEFGLCEEHACSAEDCPNNVYEPHKYCEKHECRSENCTELSSPAANIPYCLDKHACRWQNDAKPCERPRDIHGEFRVLCAFHALRQAEILGAERERIRQQQQRDAEEQEAAEAAEAAAEAAAQAAAASTSRDQTPSHQDGGRYGESSPRGGTPTRHWQDHEMRYGRGVHDDRFYEGAFRPLSKDGTRRHW